MFVGNRVEALSAERRERGATSGWTRRGNPTRLLSVRLARGRPTNLGANSFKRGHLLLGLRRPCCSRCRSRSSPHRCAADLARTVNRRRSRCREPFENRVDHVHSIHPPRRYGLTVTPLIAVSPFQRWRGLHWRSQSSRASSSRSSARRRRCARRAPGRLGALDHACRLPPCGWCVKQVGDFGRRQQRRRGRYVGSLARRPIISKCWFDGCGTSRADWSAAVIRSRVRWLAMLAQRRTRRRCLWALFTGFPIRSVDESSHLHGGFRRSVVGRPPQGQNSDSATIVRSAG